ncbi:MAG: ATP-binding protein [Candidatus Accumulibacter sp.]|jgi:hypothetical protein|nr:ATP-binding protein [Accumulibacter sp.]
MLTKVSIEGLLGVGRVELELDSDQRVYTFFGANGVGKTKCLEALYQYLLASNKDFWNFAKPTRAFGSPVLVMDGMSHTPHPVPLRRTEEKQDIGKVWGTGDAAPWHNSPVVFLGAGRRASVTAGNAPPAGALGSFVDRRKQYFNGIARMFGSGHLNSLGMSDDVRDWFVKRAQSVNPYQKSADNRQAEIDAVLSMLNTIDSRIDSKTLQIDGAGRVFLSVGEQLRELGELSSGFAALVKLVQAIVAGYAAFTNEVQLRNVRGFVLIDEIESHLHVEWQSKIIPCLKTLLPSTTFYVATHSPLVLTQLKDGEAYSLKRDERDGVVRSEVIEGANRRLFADVLKRAFDVDLNKLKHQAMDQDREQTQRAKKSLLSLLDEVEAAEAKQ